MLLWHYVYGDGSDLELPSAYFQKSSYLTRKISEYGEGEYGPIALKQSDDWRMSLALNPYYLSIADKSVKVFHPFIRFASPQGERVWTSVPIGKLAIRVYDNLVSVMDPTPFYVYSEWSLEQ